MSFISGNEKLICLVIKSIYENSEVHGSLTDVYDPERKVLLENKLLVLLTNQVFIKGLKKVGVSILTNVKVENYFEKVNRDNFLHVKETFQVLKIMVFI